MLKFKNVAVGISGGVDSAVAAFLLKNKGFNVQGVFMQNWDISDEKGTCSIENDFQDAQYVCNKLDIKLHHRNFVKEYWNEVFCPLVKEYESGFTPNPDILCNRYIKFNHFYKFAIKDLKTDAISTGHYAKSSFGSYLEHYNPSLAVRLLLAKDRRKDQTFFLSQILQENLRKVMFPLGDLTKSEVKQIAVDAGLRKIAEKPESMGICFIGSRDFQDFIEEYVVDKPGDFVDIDTNKIIGHHSGLHKWTVGQRARISGLAKAYFIARKNVDNNVIYVAQGTNHPILYTDLFATADAHWIHCEPHELASGDVFGCNFKFQHTEEWDPCRIYKSGNGVIVNLKNPKRAITPGQYAVFSKEDECLGSSKIVNSGISNFSRFYFQQNVHNEFKENCFSQQ